MLTINTNLASLIVQSNILQSTLGLNEAIEHMTTGLKINHARDNAANFSISTNLSTKLSSFAVAQDNTEMGLDMLTTGMDSLSVVKDHLSRMRDLCEQAANGTAGKASLMAIQSEIDARVAESRRVLSTTEYNKINIFGEQPESVEHISEEEAIRQGYTVIHTADELQNINKNSNTLKEKYILMNDIDLAGRDWEAIGNGPHHQFTGELNGNGYTINNLTINKPTEDNQGLFGYVVGAKISNLKLENVNITGKNNVGAIVGQTLSMLKNKTHIKNCFASGVVQGTSDVGKILGHGALTDLMEDVDASVDAKLFDGTEVASLGNGAMLEVTNIKITEENYKDYGYTLVYSIDDLRNIEKNMNGKYALMNDIDLSGVDWVALGLPQTKGANSVEFQGEFNGNGYEIRNMKINSNSKKDFQGFFSRIGGDGAVKNLNLVDVNVKTLYNHVGGVAGASSGTIQNCTVSGSVEADGKEVGLITGGNEKGRIIGCSVTGSVKGASTVGGIAGISRYAMIKESRAENVTVTGDFKVGGLVGSIQSVNIRNCYSYAKVNTKDEATSGGFVGSTQSSDIEFLQCTYNNSLNPNLNAIGIMNDPISVVELVERSLESKATVFQVGINSNDSSSIVLDTELKLALEIDVSSAKAARNSISKIDKYLKMINEKQTEFGSAFNRLESALESINVNIENLTSTRSTIRDADIAKESSEYIRNQILQQASSTLLATANQTPNIALQLI